MDSKHFFAVILAGGGGTRLWPKSRKATPKHLLKLYGDQTMLQQTYQRILPVIPKERIYLITLKDYVADVKKQLPDLPSKNIIAEPTSKNTALAMGVASAYVRHQDPEGVVINLAADALIENEKKFQEIALGALEVAASDDHIVAIGIRPTYPHTGLGYVRIGDQLEEYTNRQKDLFVFKCKGFKEKPDLVTAQSFLASGQYLWNANLYCWSTATIFKAMEEHSPAIALGMNKVLKAISSTNELDTLNDVYSKSENIQIDVAVSEKAHNLVVVPGDFGWNDVGDWKVIYDTRNKDNNGNVVDPETKKYISINSQGCLVEGNGRLIVTIGLKDIVVVDTPDALLICAKEKTQDVKKAVEQLKESGDTDRL